MIRLLVELETPLELESGAWLPTGLLAAAAERAVIPFKDIRAGKRPGAGISQDQSKPLQVIHSDGVSVELA